MLRLFDGLFQDFCLFCFSNYLGVDSINFLCEHHEFQFFFEANLLDQTNVLLYLLDIILEITFGCSLLDSNPVTHLCLHLTEDCICLCQRDDVLVKISLFEGAEDVIGFEDCVINMEAT